MYFFNLKLHVANVLPGNRFSEHVLLKSTIVFYAALVCSVTKADIFLKFVCILHVCHTIENKNFEIFI